MTRLIPLLAAALLVTRLATAQSHSGPRPAVAHDVEIPLARSAAPPEISAKAGVWFWNGRGAYVQGVPSENGVNCFVSRLWVPSVEPHCFDQEASASIFPILRRRIELYSEGKSPAEVEAQIATGLKDGTFRLPARPAVTYMMSGAQQLVTGDGQAVGSWQPHLMIYYPQLSGKQVGLEGFVAGVGFVENPETPFSALVVPLKTFVAAPKAEAKN